MSLFRSLTSYDDTIDFRRVWRVGYAISAVLVVGSILAIGVRGINLGIDFEGGTSWDVPSARSVEDTRDVLRPLGEAGAKIIVVGRGDARLVRVQSATVDEDSATTPAPRCRTSRSPRWARPGVTRSPPRPNGR